jgi:hypothetical protein
MPELQADQRSEPGTGPPDLPVMPDLGLLEEVSGDPRDTSYEIELDDDQEEPEPVLAQAIPLPAVGGGRRPVIPPHLRTWEGVRKTAMRYADAGRHHAGFHLLRAPWYLIQAVGWALWGVLVIARMRVRWWWVHEQTQLRSLAVVAGDSREWRSLHTHVRKVRQTRGVVVGAELAAYLVVLMVMAALAQWWEWAILGVVLLAVLSRAGSPADRPIITSAMTTPRARVISGDVILRACYVARLGDPEKPDQQVTFGSPVTRDGEGSRVVVDLPYGKTFADVVNAKDKLASGLDVKLTQVYITDDPSSERRFILWIADTDPLAIPAGPTPLLDCKRRLVWRPCPFGLDQFGRKVAFHLLWVSVLVGAQPRKGKTFAARLLALFCALDPYVRLTIIDGKASPDWRSFRLVAHRIIFGTQPARDGDPVEMVLDALREIKKHIQDANEFLSGLTVTECPEGKLTEELSRKYAQLRVWLLVMEEFQVYFELPDQKKNAEIADLLAFIQAVGPSVGVILISSSQKPAGVGAGDVGRLFNRFRDLHTVRFALKCATRSVSEAILGTEAYGEGFDASALPASRRYRGVGILRDCPDLDETPVVRTYLADGQDAEVILLAAREHRLKAKTLTGMAADEELAKPGRDVLADALSAFRPGEPALHWAELADRLAAQIPERWEGATADAVSAQLRGFGVPSVTVTVRGQRGRGCRREALAQAAGLVPA